MLNDCRFKMSLEKADFVVSYITHNEHPSKAQVVLYPSYVGRSSEFSFFVELFLYLRV
jgi:hypothetical protein